MTTPAPSLPTELAKRWGVQTATPIADTRTSVIHRVLLHDGSSAICKQLKPSGLHELHGIDFLAWRQGQGAVRLLDQSEMACLLEDAGALTLRNYRLEHDEEAASDIIADVLGALHSASMRSPPATLVSLRQHFKALFDRVEQADETELFDTLRRCARIADSLLTSQVDIRPLHGDLHHENIISGTARGWLAIDPQGLIGDPAYDCANVFGNPEGAFPDIIDPRRINRLLTLFAPVIGCSEEKILRYAIAHAGLSICWSLEDGDGMSGNGNAMERLAFAKAALSLLNERLV
ncbi:phosphotransferase [Aliirhizobium terrae]|uniref:aminoglycoside phosphotransferase family protein n=1 Tax=Terrirhizobium terrae TaxID=2926709 RepID=UPI0025751401|nr:aminoglycoside phosphotransferase family protein [Rhizobium sp. CC-CFT758]WJH39618.1 phosphotransferase [Rhizobium sp. CC-CFT758]